MGPVILSPCQAVIPVERITSKAEPDLKAAPAVPELVPVAVEPVVATPAAVEVVPLHSPLPALQAPAVAVADHPPLGSPPKRLPDRLPRIPIPGTGRPASGGTDAKIS